MNIFINVTKELIIIKILQLKIWFKKKNNKLLLENQKKKGIIIILLKKNINILKYCKQ